MKYILIALGMLFLGVMLVVPLGTVFVYALRDGFALFAAAITDKYALSALRLTLFTTIITVAVNTAFGLFAAWALTRFKYRGRETLATLIDVPFSISPVIAGLAFILVFGRIGWAWPVLQLWHIKVVFAVPGVVLATIFVTFPFVSREIIPVLEARGTEEEEAAALLGARGWTIFSRVTFPHIRWALVYGVILCAARATGEFGAVSVVSGHLRGKTNTLPLHIEILFNEFKLSAAFAVSLILVGIALVLLILRVIVERRLEK